MSTTPLAESAEPFSKVIREATAQVHHDAERGPLVRSLLRGELPRDRYVELVAQHRHLYEALEDATRRVAGDEVAGPFVDPVLDRTPSLEADLVELDGEDWQERHPALPATVEYARHLDALADDWPAGIVAHHYVRYLGDLSGGQMIAKVVKKAYGVTADAGASFYHFADIEDLDAYKVRYRGLIDAIDLEGEDRERFTDEVMVAFASTGAIYNAIDDLE